jgi:hypothetical protein
MHTLVKYAFLILILVAPFIGWGQNMSIKGTVYDTAGVQPLSKAMVMAVRVKDSTLIGFTRTTDKGTFVLTGFPVDTLSLIISNPGYDDKSIFIFGSKDDYDITIPSIRMPVRSKELQEIMIYANKNPIYYKGDTLVYVADSFKVAEGAVVEDLLKKLPGIKVDKDGKITSQGQQIDKVLVDGDEFFGSDPTVATKNLAADGIEQVQVYKKTDTETIGGSEQELNVIDLKLKEDAKKGYFGRLAAASDLALTPLENYTGTRPFYEAELLFNKFSGKQKISVFALSSNTPRSNFGRGELNKFGLSNERGANGNFWEADNEDNNGGIPQTLKAGIYYTEKFGKKQNTNVLFNYSYYNDRLDARSSSRTQYFLSDTTYFSDDSTRNYILNESHNINLSVNSQVDSLTLIEIKPSFSLESALNESTDLSDFTGESGIRTLATEINNTSESKGSRFNNTARLYRKFKKKRRELEVRYDINYSDNTSDGYLKSSANYLQYTDSAALIDQQKQTVNSSLTHIGTLSYFEPLSKRFKVNINYLYEYGKSNQDRSTYDAVSGQYTALREDLSNNFDNIRQQHRAGMELIYQHKNHTISAGTFVRNIAIDNINLVTDSVIVQNINNVLPKFKYEYKPSMSENIRVNYTTSSQQPSINDLQPIPDNSNPNRIQIGNPDLKPNYVHQLMINFNKWSLMSGKYIWTGGSFNLINNGFGTQTAFDKFGRTTSKTVNVDGNLSANVWVGGGYPIWDRKIEFQPSLQASFNRSKNFVGSLENITDNLRIAPELQIEFIWDSLEITLFGTYAYNNPVSSLSSVSNTPFSTQNYSLDVEWRLPKGFGIEVSGNYTRNDQPGDGFYDTEFFILDAEISKKFLKTQNLKVSIVGNDILNQNINARRDVTNNLVTDYRTTIISRYFLLKATFRFNNRKSKEEEPNGWH